MPQILQKFHRSPFIAAEPLMPTIFNQKGKEEGGFGHAANDKWTALSHKELEKAGQAATEMSISQGQANPIYANYAGRFKGHRET